MRILALALLVPLSACVSEAPASLEEGLVAGAACIRLDATGTRLTLPVTIRVTIPNETATPVVAIHTISATVSVLANLPADRPIKIEPLQADAGVNDLAVQIVNSGPPVADPNPPYPYGSCKPANLSAAPPANDFLTFAGTGSPDAAADYYRQIDPAGQKDSLDKWKVANGILPDDEYVNDENRANAVYVNAGDLGFGRSMHMKRAGANVAFYVNNHPTADEAVLKAHLQATVAMEWSAGPPYGVAFTKFYVFDSYGHRIGGANLDGRGTKYVPDLCMNCHGGSEPLPATQATSRLNGPRFIAFDLDSFEYSKIAHYTRAEQEPMFKTMNLRILDTTNVSPAVGGLVQGWYAPNLSWPVQRGEYVPPGWSGNPALYLGAVKPFCRSCHSTRNPGPLGQPETGRDWNLSAEWDFYSQGDDGGTIGQFLCDAPRFMPHALRTYSKFWLTTTAYDPPAVAQLVGRNLGVFACPRPYPVVEK